MTAKKPQSSVFYLKVFAPIFVVMVIYIITTSKGAIIETDDYSITLKLDFSRNKNTSISYGIIDKAYIYQGPIAKLFSLYQIKITVNTKIPDDEKKASLISQYMVFDKKTAEELLSHFNK